MEKEILVYQLPNGRMPFSEWFDELRDRNAKFRIARRIDRVALGNMGDRRSVGDGVFELRLHFGPGYRVYCGERDNTLVVLLCGGDKSSQESDIARAKEYWKEWTTRRQ